jgi:hypothetical protein
MKLRAERLLALTGRFRVLRTEVSDAVEKLEQVPKKLKAFSIEDMLSL